VLPLGGETASNARLNLVDGTSRMFKAVEATGPLHAAALLNVLDWRCSLSEAASHAGIPAATFELATDGSRVASLEYEGRHLLVSISAWMPGKPLAESLLNNDASNRARAQLGACAATLRHAFSAHALPPHTIQHEWNFENMGTTINAALTDPVTAARIPGADRKAIDCLVSRFSNLSSTIERLPIGLTHHDLNDFNVLVDETTGRLSGVVDFDDAREAPLISEPAIAGAYAMLGHANPVDALVTVLHGVAEVAPMNESEATTLLAGAATRLCLNAVIWTARADRHNAKYGSVRMARTWPVLRTLARIDWSAADARTVAAATGARK
jgi:hydroxylysine kinase